ncbi:MAG: sigma-54 dependent transcriptional regulator [Devosiaceae bacterium]|nr:sigma-54 dependent transcriptional regulator [Devosiaceae bacterium]
MAHEILIVDDEADIRDLIAGILEDEGFETRTAHDADSALAEIAIRRPALVFLDIWMQGSRLDGLQLLDEFQSRYPEMPVVMISGHGNVETAVSAIRRGAFDYIEKPFKMDRLLLITERAMERAQLKSQVAELEVKSSFNETELAGLSVNIQEARSIIEKSGPTNSRILITGASGTGKGLCARLIHAQSERAKMPFVEFNVSFYPPEEVFVALFGREYLEKDGIVRTEVGSLEKAHGGTLYLSEISSLPGDVQSAMLRTLVENKFTRVHGNTSVPVNVRIISSSSRNLEKQIENGDLRSDLFHRLAVVPLSINPLSMRREDIPELINMFVQQVCRMHALPTLIIGEDAIAVLQAQDWPGNARQLRNAVERVIILSKDSQQNDGVISAAMLPKDIGEVLPTTGDAEDTAQLMGLPLREAREVFERRYILAQIERFGGNISKTAQFVGMERSALHRKIKSLGL